MTESPDKNKPHAHRLLVSRDSVPISIVAIKTADNESHKVTVRRQEGANDEEIEIVTNIVRRAADTCREERQNGPVEATLFESSFWPKVEGDFKDAGFESEDIPSGDFNFEIEIENTLGGKVVAAATPLHRAAGQPPPHMLRELAAALKADPPLLLEEFRASIEELLGQSDHDAAARHVINMIEKRAMGRMLIKAAPLLKKIDPSGTNRHLTCRFLEYRLAILGAAKDWLSAKRDAEQLLSSFSDLLKEEDLSSLRLMRALGLKNQGKADIAYAVHKAELARGVANPERRGWIFRNLSSLHDDGSAEREQWARMSADAFREAGLRTLAAGSLLNLCRSLAQHDLNSACDVMNELVELFRGETLLGKANLGYALRERAKFAVQLGDYDVAAEDLDEVISLWRDLGGVKNDLGQVYLARRTVALLQGDTDLVEALTKQHADSFVAVQSQYEENIFLLQKELSFPLAESVEHQAREAEDWSTCAWAMGIRATCDGALDSIQKVELLDDAIQIAGRADQIRGNLRFKLGNIFYEMGDRDRAVDSYTKALADDPSSKVARQNLIAVLFEMQKWDQLESVARSQIELWGNLPALRLMLAVAWLGQGNVDDAVGVLWDLSEDDEAPDDLRSMAKDHFREAMSQGGSLRRNEPVATEPVTLDEWDAIVRLFAEYLKSERRRDFWRREEDKYKWVSKPESFAKAVFATWVNAKLGDRVDVFEEARSGAGWIDVYLILAGGLRLVVELKMVGGGYSSTWGYQGEDQIVHYMDNRKTHIGYLVIFDARKRDFDKRPKIRPKPPNDVRVVNVDVRMEVEKH